MSEWAEVSLGGGFLFQMGRLPTELLTQLDFEAIWAVHPGDPEQLILFGRKVSAPRWTAAYGVPYRFARMEHEAHPIPAEVAGVLAWAQRENPFYNGVLVNWYDGSLEHRIGRHRDSDAGLHVGVPILILSLGEERLFRFRCWRGADVSGVARIKDYKVEHGCVIGIPWATNKNFTLRRAGFPIHWGLVGCRYQHFGAVFLKMRIPIGGPRYRFKPSVHLDYRQAFWPGYPDPAPASAARAAPSPTPGGT